MKEGRSVDSDSPNKSCHPHSNPRTSAIAGDGPSRAMEVAITSFTMLHIDSPCFTHRTLGCMLPHSVTFTHSIAKSQSCRGLPWGTTNQLDTPIGTTNDFHNCKETCHHGYRHRPKKKPMRAAQLLGFWCSSCLFSEVRKSVIIFMHCWCIWWSYVW